MRSSGEQLSSLFRRYDVNRSNNLDVHVGGGARGGMGGCARPGG